MSTKRIAVMGATGAQGGGLVRSILAAPGELAVRAITRHPDSPKAAALRDLGAEVVGADADQPATLAPAFAGAHGVFAVTNYWEHLSPEREIRQATAIAAAVGAARVAHVVWSTLEDTRRWFPLDDTRLATLEGAYKVPHFDTKGGVDHLFPESGAPTTFLRAAFYWENFINFGMGPRADESGRLVLALPLGGAKLPGVAAGDIGKVAHAIFRRGISTAGHYVPAAGEALSGEEYAAKFAAALGRPVRFVDLPFETFRGLGFPGAADLGNMFEFHALIGEEFQRNRDPRVSRTYAPDLLDFAGWLAANAGRIAV